MNKKFYWLVAAGLVCTAAGCDDATLATGSDTEGSTGEGDGDDDNVPPGSSATTGSSTSTGSSDSTPTDPSNSGPFDPSDTDPTGDTDTDDFPEPVCGNGLVEDGEDCDGSDLGGESCGSMGAESGTLSCDLECRFETCDCVWDGVGGTCGPPVCGNGVMEDGESCDGDDIPSWEGDPCEGELGPGNYGGVGCTDECRIDTSSCASCGDGVLQDQYEDCDGPPLNENGGALECSELLGPEFGGEFGCTDDCQLDEAPCEELCGNGVLDVGEACDGLAQGEATCETLGFESGELRSCDHGLSGLLR